MNDHIHIRNHWFHTLVVLSVLSVVGVFGMVAFVYGERQQVEGYALGREAARLKNPSQEYIESGLSFCWDSGNFYPVKYTRGGFRVVKQ